MNTGEIIKSNVIFINFECADLCYTWKVINLTRRLIERLTITVQYCSSVMSKEQSRAVPVDNSVQYMTQPFTPTERELRMFNAKHGYVTLSSCPAVTTALTFRYCAFSI